MGIFPTSQGLGFAVFQGPWHTLGAGTRGFADKKDKNTVMLLKVAELIHRYHPDVIVVEDFAGAGSRRVKRIERLIRSIEELAGRKKIRVHSYSRSMIRECFAEFDAWTKQEIAHAIAGVLPQFNGQVPPPKKIWQKEHARMCVFDAVALVFTYLYFHTKKKAA